MLALTIRQPWAHAIAWGTKRIENRKWSPENRLARGRRIAIHAGRGIDNVDMRAFGVDPAIDVISTSSIIAVATFDGVIRNVRDVDVDQAVWWTGPLAWRLRDVVAIDPVRCSGARGLWAVPDPVHAMIARQLRDCA